jgi:H+/Cl- antiporter ClcA
MEDNPVSETGDFRVNSRLFFISSMAIVIGLVSAVVAMFFLKLIALITNVCYFHQWSLVFHTPDQCPVSWTSIFIPIVGGLLVGLIARYGSEKIRGDGIPESLEVILFSKSRVSPKVAVLKPISSAITIGMGGPFGAEGPIIATGGALGSLIAQGIHLSASERKTLLVAGAAAGMSAMFATPLSAILLAVEVLLFEWKPSSLIPVSLASIFAVVARPYLLGSGPLFPVTQIFHFTLHVFLMALVIGIVSGLIAALLSRAIYAVEDIFKKLPLHWMWWTVLAGVVVGLGGFWEPQTLGVGYDVIAKFIHGQIPISTVAPLVLVKIVIWAVALGAGSPGGVLAPILIIGSGLGNLEAALIGSNLSLWALVSMGAVFSGVLRAPLTGILFVLEVTHNSSILIPLLIGCMLSYMMSVLLMKHSIMTEKIARRGFKVVCDYTVDLLERVEVKEVMTPHVEVIPGVLHLRKVQEQFFSHNQKHRGYPVVDAHNGLLGILTASDVLELVKTPKNHFKPLSQLIHSKPIVAQPTESCRSIAKRMAFYSIGRLPVVSNKNPKKIMGIITRSDILRVSLRYIEEDHKEVFLGLKAKADSSLDNNP